MEGCAETGSTGRIIEGLWSMDNRGKLSSRLVQLMIDHGVGVDNKRVVSIPSFDRDYVDE